MLDIISFKEETKWNSVVKSFNNWDVYYLYEYSVSFMIHGDGIPLLFYFTDDKMRMCYIMMLNDLANTKVYEMTLDKNQYYDLTTPYGYGGPIVDGKINNISVTVFMNEMAEYCRQHNIVSQFFRFSPWMMNHLVLDSFCEQKFLKHTIFMDTIDVPRIFDNMDSKNRNMVRKAIKYGVTITQDSGERLEQFISIYNETMVRDAAEQYFFFEKEYYMYIIKNMVNNVRFFYAEKEGEIISVAMILFGNKRAHYHLSGMRTDARGFGSMNLLLYEIACWASHEGVRLFHLGGGVNAEDSLFKFKKQFNKQGRFEFWIGANVFLQTEYEELIKLRKDLNPEWNDRNKFMIKYRGQ
ncbi:lipid II:glycine glycyltransferase FemX [Eisenbergiella massiliensis]|uniref:lipid II:glycine glycyltransferase FemX n=1 Tax=Eisenbergiella massiliensis TaxID=1720294 RepID=UPI0039964CF9